jgi:hypothetical protein
MGFLYLALNTSALRQSQTYLNKTNVIRVFRSWVLGGLRMKLVLMEILSLFDADEIKLQCLRLGAL